MPFLNPKGKLSIDLLDKPLIDIYNRYSEIMGLATYHVFDDDVDFNALSIAQVKELFINNLYRAYHSQNRFSDVMDIIKNHLGVMNLKGYDKYINNMQGKNQIIELYNTICNRNTDLEKMKEIIISKKYKYEKPNSINTYSKHEIRFRGALDKLNETYPEAYKNIFDNVIKNMDEYIKNHNNNFDEMRKEIIGYLEKTYNNGEVKPPMNKDDVMSKIKDILNSKKYEDQINLYIDVRESYFVGALNEIEKKFPEEYDNILKNLMNNDMESFIKKNKYDFDKMCEEIIEFLEKTYNKDDVKPVIIQDVMSEIKDILNSKKYEGSHFMMDNTGDLNAFIGFWEEFGRQYPIIFKKVSEILKIVDIRDYLDEKW